MNSLVKKLCFLILCIFSVSVFAEDIYTFDSPIKQTRFEQLTTELRCLVCQNESLAESNAPLAKDLRGEVYQLVQDGLNEEEIKSYLVERYGQFVLFKPGFSISTLGLWTFPFLFLTAGLLILFLLSSKKKRDISEYSEEAHKESVSDTKFYKGSNKLLIITIIIFIAIFSIIMYEKYGARKQYTDYLATEAQNKTIEAEIEAMGSLDDIIENLETQVEQNQDAEGYLLLGRLYMKAERYKDASNAFARANDLDPEELDILVPYVQALYLENDSKVDAKARALLTIILSIDPNQLDALNLMATDAYERGDYKQAVELWRKLRTQLPSTNPYAEYIETMILKAQEEVGQ